MFLGKLFMRRAFWKKKTIKGIIIDIKIWTDTNNKDTTSLLKLLPMNINNFAIEDSKSLCKTYLESYGFLKLQDMVERLMNKILTYKDIFENDDMIFHF